MSETCFTRTGADLTLFSSNTARTLGKKIGDRLLVCIYAKELSKMSRSELLKHYTT